MLSICGGKQAWRVWGWGIGSFLADPFDGNALQEILMDLVAPILILRMDMSFKFKIPFKQAWGIFI